MKIKIDQLKSKLPGLSKSSSKTVSLGIDIGHFKSKLVELNVNDEDISVVNIGSKQSFNKLNTFDGGMMKYWVDSYDYGVVETAHQVLLHSILGEDD